MRFYLILLITILFMSCGSSRDNVGHIVFDPAIDNPDFLLCNENRIAQYYNFDRGLMYNGEKFEILEYFNQNFKTLESLNDNGYLTIRFVVNCKGETERFRISEMDFNYRKMQFSKSLKDQLLELTKGLNDWEIGKVDDRPFDYYQYLTYKIENGRVSDIMP